MFYMNSMNNDTQGGSPFSGEPTPKKKKNRFVSEPDQESAAETETNVGTVAPDRPQSVGTTAPDRPQSVGTVAPDRPQSVGTVAPDRPPGATEADVEQQIEDNIDAETEHLDELAKALAEAKEMRDRHLRLKAEWDNYRKRTEAERADERSRATQHLIEKILPVIDDMERALEHSEAAIEEPFKEGIAQVLAKLQGVLESEGVTVIDPQGEPFDANLHYALSKVENKKLPDETVLEVFQKGYSMGSRLLRPASVVVSHK